MIGWWLFAVVAHGGEVNVAPSPPPWRNEVADHPSPFLANHGQDGVAWQVFGAEALAEAKDRGVPIFYYAGFTGCSACDRMQRESFRNATVAAQINTSFVPVLVDRDLDPGRDAVYRSALVELGGKDGWPITLFLTPEGAPFSGGNGYWSTPEGDRPSLVQQITLVEQAWRADPTAPRAKADTAQQTWREQQAMGSSGVLPKADTATQAVRTLESRFDTQAPGWGPTRHGFSPTLRWLHEQALAGDPEAATLSRAVRHAVVYGPLRDHFGDGFFHQLDARWTGPDTHKLTEDNGAILMSLCAAASTVEPGPERDALDETIRETAALLLSFQDKDGRFSRGRLDAPQAYLWAPDRVAEVLPKNDVARVLATWHIAGESLPWLDGPPPANLSAPRRSLRESRAQRNPPPTDTRTFTSAQALAVTGLVHAANHTGDRSFLAAARVGAKALQAAVQSSGAVLRQADVPSVYGTLDDAAYTALAYLTLYEAEGNAEHLSLATQISGHALRTHTLPRGAYAYDAGQSPLGRLVRWDEDQLPSGVGTLLIVAQELIGAGLEVGAPMDLKATFTRTRRSLEGQEAGTAYPTLLRAHEVWRRGVITVTLGGDAQDPTHRALRDAINAHPQDGVTVLHLASAPPSKQAEGKDPALAAAWICRAEVCVGPVTETRSLLKAVQQLRAPVVE